MPETTLISVAFRPLAWLALMAAKSPVDRDKMSAVVRREIWVEVRLWNCAVLKLPTETDKGPLAPPDTEEMDIRRPNPNCPTLQGQIH